jgi:hypothetical protein
MCTLNSQTTARAANDDSCVLCHQDGSRSHRDDGRHEAVAKDAHATAVFEQEAEGILPCSFANAAQLVHEPGVLLCLLFHPRSSGVPGSAERSEGRC